MPIDTQDLVYGRIQWARDKREVVWSTYVSATKGWRDAGELAIAYWLGKQRVDWREEHREPGLVVKNMITPNVEIMIDGLTSEKTRFVALGRPLENEDLAHTAAEIATYEDEEMQVQGENRDVIRDYFLFGYGCGLYDFEWEEGGTDRAVARQEAKLGLPPGDFKLNRDNSVEHHAPMPDGSVMVNEVASAPAAVRKVAMRGDPTFSHVCSVDVWFDPLTRNLNTLKGCRYQVWREWIPLADLKGDRRYRLQGVDVGGCERRSEYFTWFEADDYGAEPMVEVFYYCGQDPKDPDAYILSVRVNGGADEIRRVPWTMSYLPIVVFADKAAPRALYPMSKILKCVDHQDRINVAETDLEMHRQRADPVGFVRDGTWDEKQQNKIRKAGRFTLIPFANLKDRPLADAMHIPLMPQLQMESYNARESATADIRQELGVTDYMAGQLPRTKRSPTEVSTLVNESGVRGRTVAQRWREFRVLQGKRTLAVIRDNARGDMFRPYRFLDQLGQESWGAYLAGSLSGEFSIVIEVVVDSFEAPQTQIDKWERALAMFGPYATGQVVNPETGLPYLKLAPILRRAVAAFGFERPREIELLPAPQAQVPGMPMQGMGMPMGTEGSLAPADAVTGVQPL